MYAWRNLKFKQKTMEMNFKFDFVLKKCKLFEIYSPWLNLKIELLMFLVILC